MSNKRLRSQLSSRPQLSEAAGGADIIRRQNGRRLDSVKAVVITPYYDTRIGGLEVFAHQLNVALKNLRGWDITIVTSNPSGRRMVVGEVEGMKIYRLGTWLR